MAVLRHALPVLGAIALLAACNFAGARSKPVPLPDPNLDAPRSAKPAEQVAVFAGGCFWGVEAVFEHVKGVKDAVSGYAGGSALTARYPIVGSGRTGHAESVRVVYDPAQVSYGQLLKVYFSVAHDPTQLNRQGPDTGPHYRSEIFPQSEAQAKIAKAYIAQLDAAKAWKRPIVTKTGTMKASFFPAEAYHQDYAVKHPYQPYIAFNDAPKVENLKKTFPDVWRDQPVLVSQAEKTN
jgi:peptide-methionine (S)-S-oxide reductase